MQVTKKIIEITLYYDDSGESYYVLPSGFEDKLILVNESPVDLTVRHMNKEDVKYLEPSDEIKTDQKSRHSIKLDNITQSTMQNFTAESINDSVKHDLIMFN